MALNPGFCFSSLEASWSSRSGTILMMTTIITMMIMMMFRRMMTIMKIMTIKIKIKVLMMNRTWKRAGLLSPDQSPTEPSQSRETCSRWRGWWQWWWWWSQWWWWWWWWWSKSGKASPRPQLAVEVNMCSFYFRWKWKAFWPFKVQ